MVFYPLLFNLTLVVVVPVLAVQQNAGGIPHNPCKIDGHLFTAITIIIIIIMHPIIVYSNWHGVLTWINLYRVVEQLKAYRTSP